MRFDIGKAKASRPWEGFIPNSKPKLLDQVSEVMRFKHYSLRTERTYQVWIKRYIFFHGKRHPREMGGVRGGAFPERPGYAVQGGRVYSESGLQCAALIGICFLGARQYSTLRG